jgi:small-conductance mechanosensitive channel
MNPSDVIELPGMLAAALHQPRTALQWLVIALALATGIAVRHVVHRRTAARAGESILGRLAFPLTALLIVLVGRAIVQITQPTLTLNIAVSLLLALVIVRAAAHVLRYVFAPSNWLSASERLIAAVVWLGVALHILGLAPAILEFLDAVALSVGKTRISLLSVLEAAISIGIVLVVALWAGRYLERKVMGATSVDINTRVMFAKLTRAALMLVALLVALPAVGIDLTALSVFGGALGVGLGFGLQKVASNYVSGFIILADRSIKYGDVVTVDNRTGTVSDMTSRYIVVRGADGTEAIIPNETVITSTVVNQSYSDRLVRAVVTVPVNCGADVDRALALMLETVRKHPRVLQDPAPAATLKGFTDQSIQIEAAVWYSDPENGADTLRADLALAVWRAFRQGGIDYPQTKRPQETLNR